MEVSVVEDDLLTGMLDLVLRLRADKPVYGVSFKLVVAGDVDGYDLDESVSVLGEGLLSFSRYVSDGGYIDIGMSRRDGEGYIGSGEMLRLRLFHSNEPGDRIGFDFMDIVATDERGNWMGLTSGKLEYSIGGGYVSIPSEYSLSQNYPNPFNPVTTIEYRVPEESYVLLSVYDMLGREVARLVNGVVSSGVHRVEWGIDGKGMGSGLYMYRIAVHSTDGEPRFTSSKIMTLMK